jgi:protein involved in ribonucleotide reduction
MLGVVSTGNRNFGDGFCLSGKIISEKCNVPNLASVELFGTPDDVQQVQQKITQLFLDTEQTNS